MDKVKITVTYPSPTKEKVDKEVIKLIERIGGKWYAQGSNRLIDDTWEREICFDLKV
jgi:hypothetical protein